MTMDRITDIIVNYEPFFFGLGTWYIWIGFGLMSIFFIALNLMTSCLRPEIGDKMKNLLMIVFYSALTGILFLFLLKSLLTERYDRMTIILFALILPYLKRFVRAFYKNMTNSLIVE